MEGFYVIAVTYIIDSICFWLAYSKLLWRKILSLAFPVLLFTVTSINLGKEGDDIQINDFLSRLLINEVMLSAILLGWILSHIPSRIFKQDIGKRLSTLLKYGIYFLAAIVVILQAVVSLSLDFEY